MTDMALICLAVSILAAVIFVLWSLNSRWLDSKATGQTLETDQPELFRGIGAEKQAFL